MEFVKYFTNTKINILVYKTTKFYNHLSYYNFKFLNVSITYIREKYHHNLNNDLFNSFFKHLTTKHTNPTVQKRLQATNRANIKFEHIITNKNQSN